MIKHLVIKVSGKVQGVFFRASAKQEADKLQLRGFVRNEPDGSVYIEAEGEEGPLRSFTAWCHRGPAHARVEQCDIKEGTLIHYTDFSIRR